MIYQFDTDLACEYGIDEAVMLHNFQFWITNNHANERNRFDGRTWTYNSANAFEKLFPWLSQKQIRTRLKKLVDLGVLMCGSYNSNPYDRTLWYAFADESKFLFCNDNFANDKNEPPMLPNGHIDVSIRQNESDQMGTSNKEQIIKPNNKTTTPNPSTKSSVIEPPENQGGGDIDLDFPDSFLDANKPSAVKVLQGLNLPLAQRCLDILASDLRRGKSIADQVGYLAGLAKRAKAGTLGVIDALPASQVRGQVSEGASRLADLRSQLEGYRSAAKLEGFESIRAWAESLDFDAPLVALAEYKKLVEVE